MGIKSIISYKIKIDILFFLMRFRKNPYFSKSLLTTQKKIFVFLAADYSNLGDVAITYAHNQFLKSNFNGYQVIEIPISQTIEGIHFVSKHISNGDIITTVGGGNFGNLYADIEHLRELVVSKFPKNKVVIFPITYDFTTDSEGQKALSNAQNIYNSHFDLTLIARESVTHELLKKSFSGPKLLLTPDIVLSLNKTVPMEKREGVVVALRSDKEKKMTEAESEILNAAIEKHFGKATIYDTHLGKGNLTVSERTQELDAIWNAFKKSKLVITDRLHGMIFCYITNTPCIVLMNNNHKIISSFEWIKHTQTIFLVTEFRKDRIEELFTLVNLNSINGNYQPLTQFYQEIIDALKIEG